MRFPFHREGESVSKPVELPAALSHSHYVELVEHHEISVELVHEPDEYHRAAILSDTRAAALEWLEEEGITATVLTLAKHNPPVLGAVFDIIVCKAVASPTGTQHQWRWSVRWRDWLHRFSAMRRAEQHAPHHPIPRSSLLAEVVPITMHGGPATVPGRCDVEGRPCDPVCPSCTHDDPADPT